MNILTVILVISSAFSSISGQTINNKVVCYIGGWAVYREGNAKFEISTIDPYLCTHLIYSFAGLRDGVIVSLDPYADLPDNYGKDGYGQMNRLKTVNPQLKTMIAIGGWNEGSAKYSQAVSTPESRMRLTNSIVNFVRQYNFDGFDLDWEYPAQRDGTPADKENLVLFLQMLKERLGSEGKELSIAVSANVNTSPQSYNVPGVANNVDFVNLMTYDFHASYDGVLGHNAPLYSGDNLNANSAVQFWIQQGAPSEKLVLGVPFYGRTFISSQTEIGSPSFGPGQAGPYTKEAGLLSYLELCEKFNQGGWQGEFDYNQKVPHAWNGNEWVGYDDIQSIYEKAMYARMMNLGGVMTWSLDYDDAKGVCGQGNYPLLNALSYYFRSG